MSFIYFKHHNQSRAVIEIHPFCLFSGHKRFTELLTKEEKDLSNARVPMERILTLPELKVKSNLSVNQKIFGFNVDCLELCFVCSWAVL